MELSCAIQHYEWGKFGIDSLVASLMKFNSEFILKEDIPYAELWMGTHVNGPSFLKNSKVSLDEFLQKNNNFLGNAVIETFGSKLPFLFKVLSVRKALSIQVHPNKV